MKLAPGQVEPEKHTWEVGTPRNSAEVGALLEMLVDRSYTALTQNDKPVNRHLEENE